MCVEKGHIANSVHTKIADEEFEEYEDVQALKSTEEAEEKSLYTVLNVSFPATKKNSMLLFSLDINGVAVSGGSACTSGSNIGSHVIAELGNQEDRIPIRFSFSRTTTKEELDYTIEQIKKVS